MSNNPTTKKQNNIHPSFQKELFKVNLRSAINYYGEDYMDKLLKATGGRVLHDYVAPHFTLPKKYRR